jgi:hypothetical protein
VAERVALRLSSVTLGCDNGRRADKEGTVTVISRWLSKTNVERAESDLRFLIECLDHPRLRGDLAIEFRGSAELSLYDRGFRLAKIAFDRRGDYRVTSHKRFVEGTPLLPAKGESEPQPLPEFSPTFDRSLTYVTFSADARSIHRLLQLRHILAMRSRVRDVTRREEIGVSQVIAADNMNRRDGKPADVVVIDREVGDSAKEHARERLDLLALQQVDGDAYRFLAIEVKLGNNPELDIRAQVRRGARSAVEQVIGYARHIDAYFDDYSACYRENIAQKIRLRITNDWSEPPRMVRDTRPLLAVAGYAGIAGPHLDAIQEHYPDLWVKTFGYGLTSTNGVVDGLR